MSLTRSIPPMETKSAGVTWVSGRPKQLAGCTDSNTYLKVLTYPAMVSHDMPDVNTETCVRLSRQEGKAPSSTVCSRSGEVGARLDPVVRSTGPGVGGGHGARTTANTAC